MKINEVTQLNEYFPTQLSYDAFGWVTPNGKVVLATSDDAKNPSPISHKEILSRVSSFTSTTHAFRNGWIRWTIINNILTFECYWLDTEDHSTYSTIVAAAPAIRDISESPSMYKHFIGDKARLFSKNPNIYAGTSLFDKFKLDCMNCNNRENVFSSDSSNRLMPLLIQARDHYAQLEPELFETASAGASGVGGIATSMGGGNGFLNGGPGTIARPGVAATVISRKRRKNK